MSETRQNLLLISILAASAVTFAGAALLGRWLGFLLPGTPGFSELGLDEHATAMLAVTSIAGGFAYMSQGLKR
jgi:hypothetical protein